MIHVRCGSDIVHKLAAGGVTGRVVVWTDPLCEGPVVGDDRNAVRSVRGPWLAARCGLDPRTVTAELLKADAELEAARDGDDEVVLWFESDLFDQAILVHVLTVLAPRVERVQPLSLVTLDEHPTRGGFAGLGELSAEQLTDLLPKRIPVTPDMIAAAIRATRAWSAPTPQPLDQVRRDPQSALPYLGAAVERLLEEFPERRSGIGRTERQALEAIASGATTAGSAFVASQAREERRWQGDTMFWARLRELSEGRDALLRMEGEVPDARDGAELPLALTSEGEAVLAGTKPWTGRARAFWIGGTQIAPGLTGWRWDPARRDLVRVV